MSGEIEWEPVSTETGAAVLAPTSNRLPILWRAAVLACAAVAAAIAFATPARTDGHGTAAPVAAAPAASSDSLFAGDGDIELVLSIADDRKPLGTTVRPVASAACALVMPDRPPETVLTAAVRAALPGYSLRDLGRTLDDTTALCNLTLRAADMKGSVLVIQVAAPTPGVVNPYPQITVSSATDSGATVTTARAVTTAGWSVTVGAVGHLADQPSVTTLLDLAENPNARW